MTSNSSYELVFDIFMHVNHKALNEFQREMLHAVIGPEFGPAEEARIDAMVRMAGYIQDLTCAGWKPQKTSSDPVLRPEHYDRFPMDPTYFIKTAGLYDWNLANFLKYLCRYPFKNGIEDLRKAARNLQMYHEWCKGNAGWCR